MESFGEKTRAYLYALLVHVIVIASLFIGLLWSRSATPVAHAPAPAAPVAEPVPVASVAAEEPAEATA